MVSLLRNNLFRIHNWMDRHEKAKFLLMIVGVGVPNLLIQMATSHFLLLGVFLLMFVCLFTLSRMSYLTGSLKFNHNLYETPPSVGELIIITKDFWHYDGKFHKSKPKESLSISPAGCVRKGREWVISGVEKTNVDYIIAIYDILYPNDKIEISYFQSKGFWKTKKDIRQNKLKKLGI